MKKRILCFGDSNTYGYMPAGTGRYDENERWPMLLDKLLGDDFTVVEEGFNGRTCTLDDPTEGGYKSGVDYLPPCLMTHNPLDLIIVMLGTNDSKQRFGLPAGAIAKGMEQVILTIKRYALDKCDNLPKILLIAPSPALDVISSSPYYCHFGDSCPQITRGLADEYRKLADEQNIEFMDASFAEVSPLDSVHLTLAGHKAMAEAIYARVLEII